MKHSEPASPQGETVLVDERGMLDVPYLVLTVLLTVIGLVMLFSASYASAISEGLAPTHYFIRQGCFAAAGIAVMLLVSRLNYQAWRFLAFWVLGGAVLLLIAVAIPGIGVSHNGARRWIRIGVEFQPSEFAKLGVVLTFAAAMSVYRDKMKTFRYGVLPFAAILAVIAVLLYLEPHLSATVIVLLLGAVIIVVVGFVLSNLVGKLVVKGMRARGIDPSIHTFIKTIVVLLLKFAVILSALSTMNVDVNSFIAAIGAAGITAGLGLQASVSQFASGIQILINHPFKSGDYIDLGTVSGKVHEIKMMYTELITVDNKRVIVPNSHITGSNIINYNSESKRRIDLVFGISYDADIAKAKEVIAQTVRKNELILTEPEPIIAVSAQAASSVNISCLVWCHTDDYWNVFYYMQEAVKLAFDENKIAIPYDQLDVHISKDLTEE